MVLSLIIHGGYRRTTKPILIIQQEKTSDVIKKRTVFFINYPLRIVKLRVSHTLLQKMKLTMNPLKKLKNTF